MYGKKREKRCIQSLVVTHEGKEPLGKLRCRCEDNNTKGLLEVECGEWNGSM
jgi:hypothetical protein